MKIECLVSIKSAPLSQELIRAHTLRIKFLVDPVFQIKETNTSVLLLSAWVSGYPGTSLGICWCYFAMNTYKYEYAEEEMFGTVLYLFYYFV